MERKKNLEESAWLMQRWRKTSKTKKTTTTKKTGKSQNFTNSISYNLNFIGSELSRGMPTEVCSLDCKF